MSAAARHLEEWHSVLGDPQDAATCAGIETAELRQTIITEEYLELMEAIEEGDVAHIAKELADLEYVITGTYRAYDLSPEACLAEVHRSNMSKFIGGVERRDDGKLLKGDHFQEADMATIVNTTSWKEAVDDQVGHGGHGRPRSLFGSGALGPIRRRARGSSR